MVWVVTKRLNEEEQDQDGARDTDNCCGADALVYDSKSRTDQQK